MLMRRLEKVKGEFLFPGPGTDQRVIKLNRAHAGHSRESIASDQKRRKSDSVLPALQSSPHLGDARGDGWYRLGHARRTVGHSLIQMVLCYAHPTEEHQFAAMKSLRLFESFMGLLLPQCDDKVSNIALALPRY